MDHTCIDHVHNNKREVDSTRKVEDTTYLAVYLSSGTVYSDDTSIIDFSVYIHVI